MPDNISFEEGLKKLEEIVSALENGDLSLEESIENFESGMEIISACKTRLEKAEQKIKKIVKADGKISVENIEGIESD